MTACTDSPAVNSIFSLCQTRLPSASNARSCAQITPPLPKASRVMSHSSSIPLKAASLAVTGVRETTSVLSMSNLKVKSAKAVSSTQKNRFSTKWSFSKPMCRSAPGMTAERSFFIKIIRKIPFVSKSADAARQKRGIEPDAFLRRYNYSTFVRFFQSKNVNICSILGRIFHSAARKPFEASSKIFRACGMRKSLFPNENV